MVIFGSKVKMALKPRWRFWKDRGYMDFFYIVCGNNFGDPLWPFIQHLQINISIRPTLWSVTKVMQSDIPVSTLVFDISCYRHYLIGIKKYWGSTTRSSGVLAWTQMKKKSIQIYTSIQTYADRFSWWRAALDMQPTGLLMESSMLVFCWCRSICILSRCDIWSCKTLKDWPPSGSLSISPFFYLEGFFASLFSISLYFSEIHRNAQFPLCSHSLPI